ncbi:MAG: ATP-binding cassette domain-containing protein [Firmicutes bacterium]|nr:ATP-binding cassette domain-containing protein [Bacillota bacterium]
MSKPIVKLNCLRHIYPDRTEVSLCGVRMEVHPGERVAILAANGAGKTTLLQHITGLLQPVEGEVQVFGRSPYKEFEAVRKRLGVVFQNPAEQIIGPTVREDIAFGLNHLRLTKAETDERVDEALAMLGIEHLADKLPHYLSGGELKKVALAGVLAPRPELLILDEPFAQLDPWGVRELVALLRGINARLGTALVFTSHQLEPVALLADTVYLLHQGHVVAQGTPAEVFQHSSLLEKCRLQAPDLVQLVSRLRAGGVNLAPTLDVDEIAEQLLTYVSES